MKKILTILLLSSFALYAEVSPIKLYMTDINGVKYTVTNTEEGIKISGFENKIVFLEFFGHNCPPCLASIPHLIHLQKKYKDKLAIVSIEVQGYSTAQVKQFAFYNKINYIVISEETASRVVSLIQQRAQWRGSIPFLVAMDRNGDVQYVQAGLIPQEHLEKIIAQVDTIAYKKSSKENNITKNNSIENNITKNSSKK